MPKLTGAEASFLAYSAECKSSAIDEYCKRKETFSPEARVLIEEVLGLSHSNDQNVVNTVKAIINWAEMKYLNSIKAYKRAELVSKFNQDMNKLNLDLEMLVKE